MSAQHTPGPWHLHLSPGQVEGVNVTYAVSSKQRVSIAGGQSQEHMDGITESECTANATLIASAPELLEALRGLLAAHAVPSTVCSERPAYERALAVIAKATGSAA